MVSSQANANCYLGVGLYSVADAARISGTHPETVRRWVSETRGVIHRSLPTKSQLLTFAELMEIHFIRLFRDEGVSLQVIRRTAEVAARRFNTEYPFAVKRFDTDGFTVFATLMSEQTNHVMVEDLQRGQFVFDQIVRPFFRKLEYHATNDRVARFWPQATSPHRRGRVVLDPQRKFGLPLDAETGVPTRVIFDAVNAGRGQPPKEVARWLDIPLAAVQAAIEFEQSRT